MATRSENIWRTRDLLDNSYPNKPSFHQYLRQTLSEEQDIITMLNNTAQPWTVAEFTLNYRPGLAYYDINVNDMGKILYVVRLTQNSYIPAIPVPFTDLANLQYGTLWNTFYNCYNGLGSYFLSETIEQMAFYRTGAVNQQVRVQIQPQPVESCQYVISYLVGPISQDDPLETTAALPEFATVIQLRAAMALLPYTQWTEDRGQDLERKKELAAAFQYQLARKELQMKDYVRQLTHARMVDVEDWNYAS